MVKYLCVVGCGLLGLAVGIAIGDKIGSYFENHTSADGQTISEEFCIQLSTLLGSGNKNLSLDL